MRVNYGSLQVLFELLVSTLESNEFRDISANNVNRAMITRAGKIRT